MTLFVDDKKTAQTIKEVGDNINKRKHTRNIYWTDQIVCTPDAAVPYSAAVMGDYTKEGMFIQTDMCFEVGQRIIIRMKNYDPRAEGPEQYAYYSGRVRWVREYDRRVSYPFIWLWGGIL